MWQRSLACFIEKVQNISTFLSQASLTSPLKAKERKVNSRPQDADLHHSANGGASLAQISEIPRSGPVLTRSQSYQQDVSGKSIPSEQYYVSLRHHLLGHKKWYIEKWLASKGARDMSYDWRKRKKGEAFVPWNGVECGAGFRLTKTWSTSSPPFLYSA